MMKMIMMIIIVVIMVVVAKVSVADVIVMLLIKCKNKTVVVRVLQDILARYFSKEEGSLHINV